jgi:hypothetical protein
MFEIKEFMQLDFYDNQYNKVNDVFINIDNEYNRYNEYNGYIEYINISIYNVLCNLVYNSIYTLQNLTVGLNINIDNIIIIFASFVLCYALGLLISLQNNILNHNDIPIKKIIEKDIEKDIEKAIVKDIVKDIKSPIENNILYNNYIAKNKKIYCQSIVEVCKKNDDIISKMTTYQTILLRVVMKNNLIMKKTQYELHGNNVKIGEKQDQVFYTRDMFMIIDMKYCNTLLDKAGTDLDNTLLANSGTGLGNTKNTKNIKINTGLAIINCMNYLNNICNEEYKTTDFIVIAITSDTRPDIFNASDTPPKTPNTPPNASDTPPNASDTPPKTPNTPPNTPPNASDTPPNASDTPPKTPNTPNTVIYNANIKEFENGLNNNNYEILNCRNVVINLNIKTKINCVFRLYLPIHEIYDIFMDVYNNTIFESKQYVIDDNNYESWNGKSINELNF